MFYKSILCALCEIYVKFLFKKKTIFASVKKNQGVDKFLEQRIFAIKITHFVWL